MLSDLSGCKKPSRKLPPVAEDSYNTFNVQRRFIDLDQDGVCEVMDVLIRRLGGDPSPGMRVLEQNYFHFKSGKWESVTADLQFYPYGIRSTKTQQTLFIEATIDEDVSDIFVLGQQEVRVLVPAGWEEEPGSVKSLILRPYSGRQGPPLQALAVFLTERLAKQPAETQEGSASNHPWLWSREAEEEKIRWILRKADESLRPEEKVDVDARGLPVLTNK